MVETIFVDINYVRFGNFFLTRGTLLKLASAKYEKTSYIFNDQKKHNLEYKANGNFVAMEGEGLYNLLLNPELKTEQTKRNYSYNDTGTNTVIAYYFDKQKQLLKKVCFELSGEFSTTNINPQMDIVLAIILKHI